MVLTYSISWLGAAFQFEFSLVAPWGVSFPTFEDKSLWEQQLAAFWGSAMIHSLLSSCGCPGKMCIPTSAGGIIWGSFTGMTIRWEESAFHQGDSEFSRRNPTIFPNNYPRAILRSEGSVQVFRKPEQPQLGLMPQWNWTLWKKYPCNSIPVGKGKVPASWGATLYLPTCQIPTVGNVTWGQVPGCVEISRKSSIFWNTLIFLGNFQT